jgi:orotidine-5'-phosphate decarboxylase
MTQPFASQYPARPAQERIIAALDVATAAEAREIVAELRGVVGAFKIGSQLFTAAGPSLVKEFSADGIKIFLDLKFHDIPNTVANAVVEAARLGVWMLNVHTLGGSDMMRRTVEDVRVVCEKEEIAKPLVIGVTVLTSSTDATLSEVGIDAEVEAEVLKLARLAAECGLDGVVASPHEAAAVRKALIRSDFLIVTPGIRPISATKDDQKRVKTVAEAIENGSDYLVIGRPIIQAENRTNAVREMVAEIETTRK